MCPVQKRKLATSLKLLEKYSPTTQTMNVYEIDAFQRLYIRHIIITTGVVSERLIINKRLLFIKMSTN